MKQVLKYILFTLFLPFWHLQKLIPRNRNVWIFGAWFGRKYADNPRAMFEYINKNHKNIKAVWLTDDNNIVSYLRSMGYLSYLKFSLKGIWYSLRAKFVIVCTSKVDVNALFTNGSVIVQTWHGAQMKRINFDIKGKRRVDYLSKYLAPFKYEYNYSYYLSSSSFFDSIIESAFNTTSDRVLSTGYPRNDVFYNNKHEEPLINDLRRKYKDVRIAVYMPTHRGSWKGQVQYFTNFGFDYTSFNEFLVENNIILLFKGHFYVEPETNSNISDVNNRILTITDNEITDVNQLLLNTDILITDYSSVYFDYLLTNKPIIFTPFDLEDYKNKRGLYLDYEKDVVCGEVAYNWIEVKKAIKNYLISDSFEKEREIKRNKFNSFQDGKSCERLYSLLLNN